MTETSLETDAEVTEVVVDTAAEGSPDSAVAEPFVFERPTRTTASLRRPTVWMGRSM